MRLKVEINDLTQEQWEQIQGILRVEYQIPDGASRMCLTVLHGEEERHVEASMTALIGIVIQMTMNPAVRKMSEALKESVDLFPPIDLREPSKCKCGFRAPELGPHPACPEHSAA